jgi:hypothetical protein
MLHKMFTYLMDMISPKRFITETQYDNLLVDLLEKGNLYSKRKSESRRVVRYEYFQQIN